MKILINGWKRRKKNTATIIILRQSETKNNRGTRGRSQSRGRGRENSVSGRAIDATKANIVQSDDDSNLALLDSSNLRIRWVMFSSSGKDDWDPDRLKDQTPQIRQWKKVSIWSSFQSLWRFRYNEAFYGERHTTAKWCGKEDELFLTGQGVEYVIGFWFRETVLG